jgi:alanine-synthesizing transaminase
MEDFTASAVCRLTCSSRSTGQGGRAQCRRRHHRPRHGQSGSADAAHVIDKLKETLGKPRTDRYSASRGITGLRKRAGGLLRAPLRREAQSRHPDRRDAGLEGRLCQCGAGDHRAGRRRAVPNPSYPIHAFGFLMAGGVIRSVPSEPTPQFFEAVERAIIHSIPKPLALVVCYPSNPTAYVASSISTRTWWRLRRSTRSSCCRISPMPKSISTTIRRPRCCRFLGAIDVAVEFTSMSKTYSMAGWRMGFAVGNERIIAALARVKSYLDYGAFTPIQVAATAR